MQCFDSFLIVLISMILLLPYSILAPILPIEMKNKHINQVLTGVVFSTFSLGWLLIPSLVNKYMLAKCGRRTTTQIGSLLLASSILLYGLEFYISSDVLFVVLMILTRLLEGIGATMSLTAFVALLPKLFPDQRGKAFSARYCGTTFGSSVGIAIASFAFYIARPLGMFITISFICFLGVFLNFFFPENKDNAYQPPRGNFNPLRIKHLCVVKRTFLAFTNNAISDSLYLFIQPILALKLYQDFNYSSSTISLFLLGYLGFVVISTFIAFSLSATLDKRGIIIIGDALMTVALILIGPSDIFQIPNIPALTAIGLCIGGFGQGLATGFMLEEAFKGALQKYPERGSFISDRISGIYTTLYGFCSLLIPVLSSLLNEFLGFAHTMDILMVITLLNFLVYLISTLVDLREEKKKPFILRMKTDQEEDDLL